MHEKIIAKIDLNYNEDYDEIHNETIRTGKDLTDFQVESAIITFLTNTAFSEQMLYNFNYETDYDEIKNWLKMCREDHEILTVDNPTHDELLQYGTFMSDHKHSGYAILLIAYERRFLENE